MSRAVYLVLFASSLGIASCEDGTVDVPTGTSTSSAGGTSTSTGGSGGTAPTCSLGELGSCGNAQKCSIVDPLSGEVGCVLAGTRGAWSACGEDADCVELTYCDALTGVCKPLCDSLDDCPGDGRCVAAHLSLGEPIAGLSLCTAGCHPLTGAPCDTAAGNVACVAHNPGDDVASLDCAASAGGAEDSACTMQDTTSSRSDCAQGLMCVMVSGQSACKRWCSAPGTQAECSTAETCTAAGVSHKGTAYGVCP